MRNVSPEELKAMLEEISARSMEAAENGMRDATLYIEGVAKEYCTPGHTPYSKAPYSDDNDPHRDPVHMRDVMFSRVRREGSRVIGSVGNTKEYSPFVHDGTSKMPPRPFILDAIIASREETKIFLEAALRNLTEEVWK
jgi:hypothetical protein